MIVNSLFKAVQKQLSTDPQLKDALENKIYFNVPERPVYPCVVFGIDEFIDNDDACYVKFNVQLLSVHRKGTELLKTAYLIDSVLTANNFDPMPTVSIACHRSNMVIDLPAGQRPQAIKFFYRAMMWRK